jgi:hypothetical protein
MPFSRANIATVRATSYRIPTDRPESDGTLSWDSTILIAIELRAADQTGFGYSYGASAACTLIRDQFADLLVGRERLRTALTRSFQIEVIASGTIAADPG